MTKSSTRPSDDELVTAIEHAFAKQSIPVRPPDHWLMTSCKLDEPGRRGKSFVQLPSVWAVVSVVPTIAVSALIAIAIWPTHQPTPAIQTEPKQSVAIEQPQADSTLLRRFIAINELLLASNWDSDAMAQHVHGLVRTELLTLKAGFAAMGSANGILGVSRFEHDSPTGKQIVFQYEIDQTKLEQDIERFVNGALNAEVFDSIIESIKLDPDGPQVDVRQDLFAQIESPVLIMVDPTSDDAVGQVQVELKLRSESKVKAMLEQVTQVVENLSVETYHGERIVTFNASQKPWAICIRNDRLVLASRDQIKKTISRSMIDAATDRRSR
ncbi:hypothetical protein [Rhodopirellula sp. MGV]|uniref:hypothetical protein n=1 Tax=Rhodopirellula sp. MGV TaxID=2023130 RepID=UPI00117AF335|nr:hypothetical protein [Rhodopirellula sp. MGV]